ncbi:glycosyltransferase family 4 protein [Empedobacter sp.]|uniref:glycosyltransferase family 4 protein n=1 Tax=Empedobacter sp. TaxID=1927715 RepID=UPI00289A447B|nr:glycosyltransferase family 4 protein [Empedobacter sp.]
MKILIPLVGGFGKAGGWRVLSQLANRWIKEGNSVVFLVHKKTSKPYFPTIAKITYYDNFGEIVEHSDLNYKAPIFGALKMRVALRKALDKQSADIVLATHSFTAEPVFLSRIEAKKFYYVQAYEPDYYYKKTLKEKLYKRISRKSYKLGLNIIVNAPMYLSYKEIETDMFVYPGLDLLNFKPVTRKLNDKIILGTIGRLEEYKGTTYIVEAFRKLRKEFGENIELHMAFGDSKLSNEDGIFLVIPNGDQELAAYYNSLDIYLCAGTIQLEAVHYPVIESMACKIPVITTGYQPADDSNSWNISIKNSEEILKRVKEVINEDTTKKVEKGFSDIQIFDWENVSKKMLGYFKTKL